MGMCAFTWNRVIWPLLLFQHDLRCRYSVILSLRCVCCDASMYYGRKGQGTDASWLKERYKMM